MVRDEVRQARAARRSPPQGHGNTADFASARRRVYCRRGPPREVREARSRRVIRIRFAACARCTGSECEQHRAVAIPPYGVPFRRRPTLQFRDVTNLSFDNSQWSLHALEKTASCQTEGKSANGVRARVKTNPYEAPSTCASLLARRAIPRKKHPGRKQPGRPFHFCIQHSSLITSPHLTPMFRRWLRGRAGGR